ncbi:hypothetical protein [Chitinophaga sp. XS-30]|uniref:DUF7683 domain-containing protein n=1 Tax=Chitinophaga sp. XS-30 TaxID=2604421 RepID=UPI0011DCC6DF|nr:hypothetical protein [Chitinophaga sp. XS-30]QEH41139.1 hypothetical protein FW415_09735 [Chitinophaga sp. XS-30]
MSNIERVIAYYEKQGEKFIDEYAVDIDLALLRELWEAYADDPMYYMVYPVGELQKEKLEELLGEKLDFKRYAYYLECHSL